MKTLAVINVYYFTFKCLGKKNPTEANVNAHELILHKTLLIGAQYEPGLQSLSSHLFRSYERCFPTEEATINHSVSTLREKLVRMPNLSQGIFDSHSPTQEATKKDASSTLGR